MSAAMLYHAMGIQGYREAGVDWEKEELVVHLEQPRESLRCPRCNQAGVHAKVSSALQRSREPKKSGHCSTGQWA